MKSSIKKSIKVFFTLIIMHLYFLSFSQETQLNLGIGKDASSKKEYNTALYYFNLVLNEDSSCIEAYMARAHALHMLGNYRKAIDDYNYVLSVEPKNARAYFGLASINDTWLENKYRAIEYYTKSIEISLENNDKFYAGSGYLMRAKLKGDLGDEKGHLEDLKKGADLNHPFCKDLLELYKISH